MELGGRRALLTGATGGLGRAIAQDLAAQGATVLLSGRQPEALAELAAELPGAGHAVLPADFGDPGAAAALAAEASAAGPVDVLVANAGLPGTGWLPDVSEEQIERTLRVNLEAPMILARALAPAMVARGAGALVFVASLSGKAASPRSALYNATKFGLRGFAFGLRTDLGPRGVGVSVVSPGFVRDAGMFAKSGARTPPGMGTSTPTEVGKAVVKAVGSNRAEIVVAPPVSRALSHFAAISPAIAARVQSAPVGQKAAEAVAAGHDAREAAAPAAG
ncbi:MAG TPA: SDR family NAD(P)-dependent oxidoreductase, partial [Solirubrobacterales bacterium]|nr:SDR family NAD(P)-dependent oxidoreductase [Solirubrobacterales bacterium]